MTPKRIDLLRKVVEDSNLDLVDAGKDGARLYAVMRAMNGQTLRVSIGGKSGDMRSDLNETARIKRFAKANNVAQIDLPLNAPVTQSLTEDDTMANHRKLPPAETPEVNEPLVLTPELEKAAAPGGRKGVRINRMTQSQFYLLVEFIKPLDTLQFATAVALAKHASKELVLPVSESSVLEALKLLDKTTRYMASRVDGHHKTSSAISTLARNLVALFEHLGEQVPADLRRLVK